MPHPYYEPQAGNAAAGHHIKQSPLSPLAVNLLRAAAQPGSHSMNAQSGKAGPIQSKTSLHPHLNEGLSQKQGKQDPPLSLSHTHHSATRGEEAATGFPASREDLSIPQIRERSSAFYLAQCITYIQAGISWARSPTESFWRLLDTPVSSINGDQPRGLSSPSSCRGSLSNQGWDTCLLVPLQDFLKASGWAPGTQEASLCLAQKAESLHLGKHRRT